VTTPPDPFAAPGGEPQGQQPGYGAPTGGYGQPPAYGAPPSATSPYGQAPATGWQGPPLAGWGSRVGAALVDGLIAAVIEGVGVGLGALIGGALGALLVGLGYLGAFAFTLWNLVQQGNTGQTVGKKALNLRLLREQDGQVVGIGTSIGRYFVHFLDAIPCLIGYLWPLWDAKNQTFADKILKTVVIKA
jgi:uncharacterized RDD family membrane protein YckC